MSFAARFGALTAELETGRQLSSVVLPPLDATEGIKEACADLEHPLRAAAREADLVKAVVNLRPGETFAGKLDGPAVAALVGSFYLLEDLPASSTARRVGPHVARPVLELAMKSTDTMPVAGDPTPVQLALLSFCKGEPLAECTAELALAARGRSAEDLKDVFVNCIGFMEDVSFFLADEETDRPAPTEDPYADAFYAAATQPLSPLPEVEVEEPTPAPPLTRSASLRVVAESASAPLLTRLASLRVVAESAPVDIPPTPRRARNAIADALGLYK
jgi:hypothetical protein